MPLGHKRVVDIGRPERLLLLLRIRTTAGLNVLLSSLLATGAEVTTFLSGETPRVGGYHGPGGLLFAGRVGTDFSERILAELYGEVFRFRNGSDWKYESPSLQRTFGRRSALLQSS
jgi:hypothetical protein